MVLRKNIIDKSRKNIPKSEQTREKDIKPKTIKIIQILANKVKIFHKTLKNS